MRRSDRTSVLIFSNIDDYPIKMVNVAGFHFNVISRSFWVFFALLQVAMIIIYGVACKYDTNNEADLETYGFYKDVAVMIIVGFGYLMMFLQKYGYGAIGFTYLVAAFCIQFTILTNGFFNSIYTSDWSQIEVGVQELLQGLFGAAVVLITFGGVIGKISPDELLVIAMIELLKVLDVGGSIVIHTFGAYFGLAVTYVISPKHHPQSYELMSSVYHSDLFTMIGTTFLWIYWPSFNASAAPDNEQSMVVTNTVISLCSSTLSTFTFSRLLSLKGRYFSMVDIQNATLAGGVAVGAVSNFDITPAGAMTIGFISGFVSVVGYHWIQPFLALKIDLQDTCGIGNLHGMPGLIGGFASIFMCLITDDNSFKYPSGRSGPTQAGIQAAGLSITFTLSIVGGLATGALILLSRKLVDRVVALREKQKYVSFAEQNEYPLFADEACWEVPADYQDEFTGMEHPQNLRAFQSGLLQPSDMIHSREEGTTQNIQEINKAEQDPLLPARVVTFKRTRTNERLLEAN